MPQSMLKSRYCLNLILNASFLFLLFIFYFTAHDSDSPITHLRGGSSDILWPSTHSDYGTRGGCPGLQSYHSHREAQCAYVKAHAGCGPLGYIPYLQYYYCNCKNSALGYTVFIIWMILLFYLLGTTAANFFCSSLDGMSRFLKLSPAVAGVTLLSLGNGAPDLFSSIVSSVEDGESSQIGLNSILGGAFFVSCVVIGIISIFLHHDGVSVEKSSFQRDVLFFLISLSCLLLIIIHGKINFWGALCFLSLYIIYAALVSTSRLCINRRHDEDLWPPGLPTNWSSGDKEALEVPFLISPGDDEKLYLVENGIRRDCEEKPSTRCLNSKRYVACSLLGRCLYLLELPLCLPRRLTIPVVSEENWSKPFAVLSAAMSPVFLAFLSNPYFSRPASVLIYTVGCSAGVVFGVLASLSTESSAPPKKCLFPWLAGGFVMSVSWTYILARELVSLLVSLGLISGISSSVLGLTVLAWGNSLGDLVTNLSIAKNGGAEGAQIAISGCYAGPLFNMLMGVGISLVLSSWAVYPADYVLPGDPYIFEIIGFLAGGLLFALVILSKKSMKLDRHLGMGLLAIYMCFLFLRIARAVGLLHSHHHLLYIFPLSKSNS